MKYLFFDIECANCYQNCAKIFSLGYLITDENFHILHEKEDVLINPRDRFDWYVAKKMMAYPREIFKDMPPFPDFYDRFREMFEDEDTMVIGYAVIEVLLQLSDPNDGISHLAHLGGLLGGYAYIKYLFRSSLPWDPLRHKPRPGEERVFHEPPRPASGDPDRPVSGAELDALLDKVSRFGINSLSEYELARLRKAREQMRGK